VVLSDEEVDGGRIKMCLDRLKTLVVKGKGVATEAVKISGI
jgi:hypothetical protein